MNAELTSAISLLNAHERIELIGKIREHLRRSDAVTVGYGYVNNVYPGGRELDFRVRIEQEDYCAADDRTRTPWVTTEYSVFCQELQAGHYVDLNDPDVDLPVDVLGAHYFRSLEEAANCALKLVVNVTPLHDLYERHERLLRSKEMP